MKKKIAFFILVLLLFPNLPVFGQDPIEMEDLKSIISTEMKGMEGQVCDPQICPSDPHLVSFQRRIKDSQELYFIDLLSGKIEKVTSQKQEEKKEKYQEESTVTAVEGVDWQLDWRPVRDKQKRQWYVFTGDGGIQNFDLYLGVVNEDIKIKLNDDGGANNFVDVQPKWSPDGKQIVFVSSRTGNGDLYLIEDVDKTIDEKAEIKSPRQLTTNSEADFYPAWNPDTASGYIAYTAENKDSLTERCYLINLLDLYLGLATIRITEPTPGSDYTRPSWDPTTGSYLSYFVSKDLIKTGGFNMKRGGIPQEQTAEIGISKLELGQKMKLQHKEIRGEDRYLASDVMPDDYSGPLWLNGSQFIIFVKSRLEKFNPIYVANRKYWELHLGKFTYKIDQDLKMPVDLSVEKDKIVFACQAGKEYKIIMGTLSGMDFQGTEYPQYALSRPELYKKFLEGKAKLGEAPAVESESPFKWFLKPIIGNNPLVFLNRRITPMVLGLGVATYLLWPGKEKKLIPDRTWFPPDWPKTKIGLKIVF